MAKEIERKYLINLEKWQQFNKPAGQLYRQGYLSTDPHRTITDTTGYLTIKGLTTGATRLEYEYEIPHQDAKELLDNFAVTELSKTRYKINYHGKVWEVDEFSGDNSGLIIAEIELQAEDENFDIPEWVGKEVTGEEKYYNANLTMRPYTHWDK